MKTKSGTAKPEGKRSACGRVPLPSLTVVLGVLGLLMTITGALTAIFWPAIFQCIIKQGTMLTPNSRVFDLWSGTPVPIYIDFYFYNWTNPEGLLDGERPQLDELGPYRFYERQEKVDVEFHDNYTVTYRQVRFWRFDEAASVGSLQDEVTTLNPVPLTAAYASRDWNFMLKTSMSVVFTSTRQRVAITRTVNELLFEGYDDPLLTMGSRFPSLNIPYDKFGWFYTRNGSASYDGLFNMDTGDGGGRLGELRSWNGKTETGYYPDECGKVRGSAGQFWPAGSHPSISLFSPDICRPMTLPLTGEMEILGLRGLRYSPGKNFLDNGTTVPGNQCYCGGKCVPSGALNVSTCRFGAPGFVSFPHFLDADQSYRDAVEGMRPDASKHSFHVVLEPTTGIPLDVAARFQINLLMQSYPNVALYSKVPTIFFPMMWFEARASITEELAAPLRQLLALPDVALVASLVGSGAGILLLVFTAYRSWHWRRKEHRSSKMQCPGPAPECCAPLVEQPVTKDGSYQFTTAVTTT